MAELKFVKVKAIYAQEICENLELGEEAVQWLSPELTPEVYLERLQAAELYPDAVKFLALALPKREATWWACLAARHGVTENTPAREITALEAAEAWVYKPNEENRRLTWTAAEACEFKTATSWAAVAAFWSSGSMSPVPDVMVAPPEDLTAKAVAGAIMLAAAGKPAEINRNYAYFLKQGLDIACGGDGRSA